MASDGCGDGRFMELLLSPALDSCNSETSCKFYIAVTNDYTDCTFRIGEVLLSLKQPSVNVDLERVQKALLLGWEVTQ